MASVIDSFKEIYGDRFSFIKIFVFSALIYYCSQLYIGSKNDFEGFYLVLSLVLFLLFGFLAETTNNVINEKDHVLSSLNPIKLSYTAIKGILAITPYSIVALFLANYFSSMIHIMPWLDIILKTTIWLIAASIIITPFLMFAANKRILDAYNIKIVFEKAGDVMVTLIVFLIQLIITNLPTFGFLGYVLFIIFSYGIILNIFICIAIIFNIGAIGHYLGQVHYEVIGHENKAKS